MDRRRKQIAARGLVIGKDTRRSSYMFEYSLVSGLTASGADVYLLHVTTTPSVSYVVRTEEFDCGIMISASHNPYYDNGIKVINGRGEKLEEETIEKIESYLDGEMGEIPFAKRMRSDAPLTMRRDATAISGYLISLATRSFKNMRVGLDCANGSASAIAKNVFDALGAETHVINNTPDGLNINTNCGSTHIEGLQKYVVENHLDVGFAYDGDADRCLAVDSEGKLVDGDKILYVCGKYMKEQARWSTIRLSPRLCRISVFIRHLSARVFLMRRRRLAISMSMKICPRTVTVWEASSRAISFSASTRRPEMAFNIVKADGSDSGEERDTCKAG